MILLLDNNVKYVTFSEKFELIYFQRCRLRYFHGENWGATVLKVGFKVNVCV